MVQIFIGAFLISFSSVFVKLVHVGPTTAMFYRFAFGAVTLFITALVTKTPVFKGARSLFYAGLAGFFFFLDLFIWHRSILYIGPGLATILANLQIFILTLVGILFLGERLRFLFIVSVFIAFTGLILLVGMDISSMDSLFKKGVYYGLLTAFTYSGITLTIQKSRHLPDKLNPLTNMAWLCFFGMSFAGAAVLPSGETFIIPDMTSLIYLIAYGIVCSSIGWYLITKGLQNVSISMAGLALILQPSFAFLWDVLMFDKPVSLLNTAGAAITIIAIYLGAVTKNSQRQ